MWNTARNSSRLGIQLNRATMPIVDSHHLPGLWVQDTYKSRSSRLSVIGSFGIFAFAEKYFCLGLDIWVTQIVEANIKQSRLRQKFLQLPVGAVGVHRRFWPRRIVKNPGGEGFALSFPQQFRCGGRQDDFPCSRVLPAISLPPRLWWRNIAICYSLHAFTRD